MNKILTLTLLIVLAPPSVAQSVAQDVGGTTLYDQFKNDFEITDTAQDRSIFKDKKHGQSLTVRYNKKGQPYRMEATQNGKTSEVREFSGRGITRQEFSPQTKKPATKWEYRYVGDRLEVYKNSKKYGSTSLRDAFSYDVPACIDNTQVQPIIEQLQQTSTTLSLIRRLSSNIEVENRCSATGLSEEILRARMEDALRNGVSCLLRHGPQSRLDAARLLSVFQSRRPFQIYCRGENEPFCQRLDGVNQCNTHRTLNSAAFAVPCGSDHYPGMVLNSTSRDSTSPATLFHEAMHQLGYVHADGNLDVTYLAEACCFGRETYEVAPEVRSTACSLIENRPAPDSREYVMGMIQVMATPMSSSNNSNMHGGYIGEHVVEHVMHLLVLSDTPRQKSERSLLLRDVLIQLTSRARALDEDIDNTYDYFQYNFYAQVISPTLNERQRVPLVERVINRGNISQNAKNVLQAIGQIYAYIDGLRNSHQRASVEQVGVLLTNLRQSVDQMPCSSERERAEAQALNTFVTSMQGAFGSYLQRLYQRGACS